MLGHTDRVNTRWFPTVVVLVRHGSVRPPEVPCNVSSLDLTTAVPQRDRIVALVGVHFVLGFPVRIGVAGTTVGSTEAVDES